MALLLTDARNGTNTDAPSGSNLLLGALGVAALEKLSPNLESVSLKTGDELYTAGWPNEYVYFPGSAVISHIHNAESGGSVEIAMVGMEGASGLCGVVADRVPLHSAVVTVGGSAQRVDIETLIGEVNGDAGIQKVLFDYTMRQLLQVSQRVVCGSFHLADSRLSSWLLMLHDRVQTDRMKMTHEQISSLIGLSRCSVSMIAKSLRERGVIDYVRGDFHIINRRQLEMSACECYSAVRVLNG